MPVTASRSSLTHRPSESHRAWSSIAKENPPDDGQCGGLAGGLTAVVVDVFLIVVFAGAGFFV